MRTTRTTRVLWLLVTCAWLAGCELIADFDRGLLDAGTPDTGSDEADSGSAPK